jgi:hypothetical protein
VQILPTAIEGGELKKARVVTKLYAPKVRTEAWTNLALSRMAKRYFVRSPTLPLIPQGNDHVIHSD